MPAGPPARDGEEDDERKAGLHDRVFRLLLRLYPRSFREEYGDEMTRYFLERLTRAREQRKRQAVISLWARTALDLVRTAAAERGSPSGRHEPTTGAHPMSAFLQDLRYAARRLRNTPLFTISAIAILAVGIGLNASVFSLVDTAIFRPPPFTNAEEIVHIYQDSDDGDPSSTSYPEYREMAEVTDVFAGVAATSSGSATWEGADSPRQVSIEFATASYFPVLGLRPVRGRWFDAEHDQVGAEMVAVVSHRAWRTLMGEVPDAVGRTIRLNNQPVTIIGVGPTDFNGEAGALVTDFWLSISSTPVGGPFRVANLERRQDHWYQVKARLAPGVTVERARAAMDALARGLAEAYPELNEGRGITVFAFDEVRFHPAADAGIFRANVGLFAVAALVLLLACTNLANLLLVRGISRGPEMAVREALGAGRKRVVRLFLLEALLLSAIGGGAGLAVAAWSVRFVPLLPIPTPGGGLDVSFDHRVAIFGLLLTLATGLIFGLLPALRSSRTDVAAVLRDEGVGRSAGRRASVFRAGLVAVQVAVSVVLIVGAGLLARSLANAQRVDAGVDVGRIAVVGTNLPQGGVTGPEVPSVTAALLERVEAMPGVERAAITTRLPVQPGGTTTQIVEGYEPRVGTGSVELPFAYVSRGYFETMGIRVVAGRTFALHDRPETPRVIVVNETAASLYWGGDALGGRIRSQGSQGAWVDVVGVVADVKVNDLREAPTPMIYYSADQSPVGVFSIVARTAGEPAALAGALRSVMRDVRPSLPVTRQLHLDAHVGNGLAGLRAATALMGGFSLLALMLAGLGVYAVVSFAVERRTQEMGIRVALGAPRSRIVGMIVGQSLVMVAVGLAAGLWLAVLAMRGLEGMLFGVGAVDEVTFAGAAVLLLLAAATAAFVPAQRAARANPVEVLRSH
ncbi:MAG TPA: ADOP family duplicated permease [Gemmatimonadaceae bacterium]|nr:ADOP family duplicated permease [Gemmatimonadaceae bacterium]